MRAIKAIIISIIKFQDVLLLLLQLSLRHRFLIVAPQLLTFKAPIYLHCMNNIIWIIILNFNCGNKTCCDTFMMDFAVGSSLKTVMPIIVEDSSFVIVMVSHGSLEQFVHYLAHVWFCDFTNCCRNWGLIVLVRVARRYKVIVPFFSLRLNKLPKTNCRTHWYFLSERKKGRETLNGIEGGEEKSFRWKEKGKIDPL